MNYMARPERFELPTAWFVVFQLKRPILLFYLLNINIFCPIEFAYLALFAFNWGYLVHSIGQLRRLLLQVHDRQLSDDSSSYCMSLTGYSCY